MGRAAAEIRRRRPKIATIQIVEVVPSVAPTIIPIACEKVTSPALTKPMTVRIAAVEDWITAVKSAPDATALKRPATSRWSARRRESPARPFMPSVRWWMPRRKRPSPPRSVTRTAESIRFLRAGPPARSRRWRVPRRPARSTARGLTAGLPMRVFRPMRRTPLRSAAVVACLLALASDARAELQKWDQARVTELAKQLDAATSALSQSFRRQPTPTLGAPHRQRFFRLQQEVRLLDREARFMSRALQRGADRDEAQPSFDSKIGRASCRERGEIHG